MKLVLALVLSGLCALVVSSPTGEGIYQSQYKIADKDLLEKQLKVLSLFYHINQPDYQPDHVEIVESYKLEENKDQYTKPEAVERMIEHYTNGYQLPKGQIFYIGNEYHLDQAMALFELLYYAKDFETFYKTAVIARHWVNEGLFLYSYSVAIVYRPDCYGIVIPPIYEVYPWYFFSAETIQAAYKYKQEWNGQPIESGSGKYPGYTVVANYSGDYLNLHPEQSLSYYLEDVGINSFYYTYSLYYPFWLDGEKFGVKQDRRGDLYFFVMQQLLSRFYLERLSNGFGQVPTLDVNVPIETPYYPSLQYPNGIFFPERPKFARLSDYFYQYGQQINSHVAFSYTLYNDNVRRMADAITRGYVFNKKGEKVELYNDQHSFNDVSNLLQGNPDSPDNLYYGFWLVYGRYLLGYAPVPITKYKVAPGAIQHFETSLRDPAFYQLYKKLFYFYYRYQAGMAPYTREELIFPGVSIENVEVDRLITYFDEFYADLTQAVSYSEDDLKKAENNFYVRAKQYRLNHKPFTYKIYVKSDKDVKSVVKIFLGPKYDEYGRYLNISDSRYNFYQVDKFVYDLKSGENVIKRSSLETELFGPDKTSYYDLYKEASGAVKGDGQFNVDPKQIYFTFPQRYLLPKGTLGGFPFQFYFIVYPFKAYAGNKPEEWTYNYPRPGVGGPYIDDYPIFYPFDRLIKYGNMFTEEVPNSFFYEAKVFHRKDINAVTAED